MSFARSPHTWDILRKYTACDISDALLKLNVPGAGFLPDIVPRTRPHDSITTRLVRPCTTVLFGPKSSSSFPLAEDALKKKDTSSGRSGTAIPSGKNYCDLAGGPDRIVVLGHHGRDGVGQRGQSPGHISPVCAMMGGILGQRLKKLGTEGVLVDGRVRDVSELREMGLEVWSRGISSVGAGGQLKAVLVDAVITIEFVSISPGDLIMLDQAEGCAVAIPANRVEKVIEMLPGLVEADDGAMADVRDNGMSVEEAFKKWRG